MGWGSHAVAAELPSREVSANERSGESPAAVACRTRLWGSHGGQAAVRRRSREKPCSGASLDSSYGSGGALASAAVAWRSRSGRAVVVRGSRWTHGYPSTGRSTVRLTRLDQAMEAVERPPLHLCLGFAQPPLGHPAARRLHCPLPQETLHPAMHRSGVARSALQREHISRALRVPEARC